MGWATSIAAALWGGGMTLLAPRTPWWGSHPPLGDIGAAGISLGWLAFALGCAWIPSLPLGLADRRDGAWILEAVSGIDRRHSIAARGWAWLAQYSWLHLCALSGVLSVLAGAALARGVRGGTLDALNPLDFGPGHWIAFFPVAVMSAVPVWSAAWKHGASTLLIGVFLLELCALVLVGLVSLSMTVRPPLLSALFPVLGSVASGSYLGDLSGFAGYHVAALVSSCLYAIAALGFACRTFLDSEAALAASRPPATPKPGVVRPPGLTPHADVEHSVAAILAIGMIAVCAEPLLRGFSDTARLLIRELGIILLPTLALATLFRLPFRETFALRTVPPNAWIGAVVLAVGMHFLLREVADVVQRMVPPDPGTVKRLTQEVEGVGRSQGAMGTLLVLALVPAVVEEFLFRGFLLSGLSRAFGAIGGVLSTGVLFGLVHGATARAVPLALFGVVLALAVRRSGSLYPAMAAHAANNTVVLLAILLPAGVSAPWLRGESPVPAWTLAGGAALAATGWMLLRPSAAGADSTPTQGPESFGLPPPPGPC